MITERDVNFYWQEYANTMPKEQVALSTRMHAMHLTLLDDTSFEVVVDNELIAKEFIALIPSVESYLRTRLKNGKVAMKVRVSAPSEKTRAYSRVEKYQMMAQKNNALQQLREEFGLELF